MNKVLLVNPPDGKMIQGAIPRELGSDKMGKYPPLGLLYLASSVRRSLPEIEVRIVDAIADGLGLDDLRREIESFRPDLVGVTVYTFTLVDALEVAGAVKAVSPGTAVVFGGFHPGIYPRETLACSRDVDFAVAGEAEETFVTLLERLAAGRSPEGIPGVSFRKSDGTLHVDPAVPFVADLDQLPLPDRTMVNFRNHTCILGATGLSTSILSSRGCPFSCQYCFVNVRNYRLRALPNLLTEMRQCLDLGIRNFFFMDDLFNLTKQRVLDFSSLVIRERLPITWSFRGRVNQVDPDVLRLARKAGCTRIHYGVESGVPEILRRIRKGTDLDMVRQALRLTRNAGIEVSSNIMLGLPGESPRETEQTIRYLLDLDTDYLQAAVFTPYPETPLYKEGLASGLLPHDYWREFASHPTAGFTPLVWGEFYTSEQLFDKLRELYRRFYLRPRFIAGYLRHLTSFGALAQMARNGVTFLNLIRKRSSHGA